MAWRSTFRECAAPRMCRRKSKLLPFPCRRRRALPPWPLPRAIEVILSGGDDYEILAAVPSEHCPAFETASSEAGVPVTKIGVVKEGAGAPVFLKPDGTALALAAKGFEHFSG